MNARTESKRTASSDACVNVLSVLRSALVTFRLREQLFLSQVPYSRRHITNLSLLLLLWKFYPPTLVTVASCDVTTILIGYHIKPRQRKPISALNNSHGFINGHCLVDQWQRNVHLAISYRQCILKFSFSIGWCFADLQRASKYQYFYASCGWWQIVVPPLTLVGY